LQQKSDQVAKVAVGALSQMAEDLGDAELQWREWQLPSQKPCMMEQQLLEPLLGLEDTGLGHDEAAYERIELSGGKEDELDIVLTICPAPIPNADSTLAGFTT
jgi:hypothetical protein